jgi:ribose transport system ATP-binding protein
MERPTATQPLLALKEVSKSYGETQALVSIDLSLGPGAVHGLVGENGAGKSTLVKILSGVVAPDGGAITLDGNAVELSSPAIARELGISTVFQELTLIPDLTVAENILLQSDGAWTRSRRERLRRADAMAARWGVSTVDMRAKLSSLSLRDRQIIEILCAVDRPHKVLILDEPTSALLPDDTRWLRSVVQRCVSRGAAVVFISHMLDEVEEFCDEVSVQRNGVIVADHTATPLDRDLVVKQMIGRSLESAFPPKNPLVEGAPAALRVRGLQVAGVVHEVDLDIARGEIVGVAALDGQGQAELFRALAGDLRVNGGTIELNGHPVRLGSPRRAIRAGGPAGGIAFVPADRKSSGTVLDLTVRKNISLPVLRRVAASGVVNDRRETGVVSRLMDLVQVDQVKIDHPVRSLSGGNQQKVSFARAAGSDSAALLLYDPTRGVDVGTKYELYRLIHELAEKGTAVLFYSTEIPEIVNVCHRALVCYGGRIAHEVPGDRLSESELMSAAIGLEAVEVVQP